MKQVTRLPIFFSVCSTVFRARTWAKNTAQSFCFKTLLDWESFSHLWRVSRFFKLALPIPGKCLHELVASPTNAGGQSERTVISNTPSRVIVQLWRRHHIFASIRNKSEWEWVSRHNFSSVWVTLRGATHQSMKHKCWRWRLLWRPGDGAGRIRFPGL